MSESRSWDRSSQATGGDLGEQLAGLEARIVHISQQMTLGQRCHDAIDRRIVDNRTWAEEQFGAILREFKNLQGQLDEVNQLLTDVGFIAKVAVHRGHQWSDEVVAAATGAPHPPAQPTRHRAHALTRHLPLRRVVAVAAAVVIILAVIVTVAVGDSRRQIGRLPEAKPPVEKTRDVIEQVMQVTERPRRTPDMAPKPPPPVEPSAEPTDDAPANRPLPLVGPLLTPGDGEAESGARPGGQGGCLRRPVKMLLGGCR